MIYDDNTTTIVITAVWSRPLALCNNVETGPYSRVVRAASNYCGRLLERTVFLPRGSLMKYCVHSTGAVDVVGENMESRCVYISTRGASLGARRRIF
jgi:hypothetical protein